MKRFLYALLLMLSVAGAQPQVKSGDAALDRNLDKYVQLTKTKDFAGLMDYVHPALFRLVPREQMVQVFEQTFSDPSLDLNINSVTVKKIGVPFNTKGAQYRKIDYDMSISMRIRDSSVHADEMQEQLLPALKEAFKSDDVRYDAATQNFIIRKPDVMYAIRDKPGGPWKFIGYQKNKQLVEAVFSKEAIAHYGLL